MSKRYTPHFGGNPRQLCVPGGQKCLWSDGTKPTDGVAGYEGSCFHQDTTNKKFYINDGTSSSADFNRVPTVTDDTTFTATGAEINRVADVSGRAVAAGASLALTQASHDGKTILLDTAASSAVTLPQITTSTNVGCRFRFIVKTKATSGSGHTITGYDTDSLFVGSIAIHDRDGATASWVAADASDDHIITLNGTTKGGQVGDWIEVELINDSSTSYWAVTGQLSCPTGSDPATCFS